MEWNLLSLQNAILCSLESNPSQIAVQTESGVPPLAGKEFVLELILRASWTQLIRLRIDSKNALRARAQRFKALLLPRLLLLLFCAGH